MHQDIPLRPSFNPLKVFSFLFLPTQQKTSDHIYPTNPNALEISEYINQSIDFSNSTKEL